MTRRTPKHQAVCPSLFYHPCMVPAVGLPMKAATIQRHAWQQHRQFWIQRNSFGGCSPKPNKQTTDSKVNTPTNCKRRCTKYYCYNYNTTISKAYIMPISIIQAMVRKPNVTRLLYSTSISQGCRLSTPFRFEVAPRLSTPRGCVNR